MGTGIDRVRAGYEQTNTFTFTAEQIRTLNSLPVEMVPAPGVNMVALPISAIVAFKAAVPPVAFSSDVAPTYQVAAVQATAGFGVGATVSTSWAEDPNLFLPFTADNNTFEESDLINQPIELTSGSDVTDGDGVLTIILTYRVIDLTGLI